MQLRQNLRVCTSRDGTRIAIASIGAGPPLLRAAHWLSHVEHDLESPVWRPWLAELSRQHTYIRYDQRGSGLSDSDASDFSLDSGVADLEAVVESLGLVRVPTLVLHARGDSRVPFDEGRRLAALIPGARFVPLDSDNHVLLDTEPAWAHFLAELRGFLGGASTEAHGDAGAGDDSLTPAEREVLRLVAQGLDNHAIALQLKKSEKKVRNQVSSIFDKLGVRTRAEGIVFVRNKQSGTG